jgi:hypothetical protein
MASLGLKLFFVLVIIGAVFISSLAPTASAQTGGAIVRPDPATFEIGQGQVETINIVLENAKDAYGIEVRAKFDPAVVEVFDSDPNQTGVQMIPGSFIKPDFLVRNTADNQKGTLQYVITQVNPTPPVNGNGVVLSIQLRGKTLGKKTTLTIDFVDIADRQGRKLPVRGQSGTLNIVQPKPPTPTATLSVTPTVPATPTLVPSPIPSATLVLENKRPLPSSSGFLDFSDLEITLMLVGCLGLLGAMTIVGITLIILGGRKPPARRAVERNYPQR